MYAPTKWVTVSEGLPQCLYFCFRKSGGETVLHCHLCHFTSHVKMFNSATAIFVAPSDLSGIDSIQCEFIGAVLSWQGGPAHYNCVYVGTDNVKEGMLSMDIV